jgi:2-polyprenyl-3-methyl-5-hydroxy-6-metoxy-1,4-benzoquinol methylase
LEQGKFEIEAANLRRVVAEMHGSLSWKITAPLRFITKPLFRARRPGKPQAKPGIEPACGPTLNGSNRLHDRVMGDTDFSDAVTGPTLDAICGWYHINLKFAHAALETLVGIDYDRNIGDIHEFLARYERLRNQLEYTFATNTRGQNLANQLRKWGVPLGGRVFHKSYLDIGFAYGGSLSAFASLGYDTVGIEISQKIGALGRLNLESSGYSIDTRIGDFLSDEVLTGEPRFDLITCIDVIEHVSDPAACLHKICRLLKPGGTAYVAYPTKLSIPYVRADAHAQLFGLTLLDYFRAREAYIMYTGWPEYEVSDFYEPEWYLNTARSAGAEAELVYDSSAQASDVPDEIAMLYVAFSDWVKSGSRKLSPLMRHEITRELANYSARLFQSYSEHVAHNSVDQFVRKWIDPLTRILIRKPSA